MIIHRPFNEIVIYSNTLIKTSPLKQGVSELYWYHNIPEDYIELVPEIYSASFVGDDRFSIEMEYLKDYNNLGDLFIANSLTTEHLTEVLRILQLFRNDKWDATLHKFPYVDKVYDRVESMELWKDFLDNGSITINGKKYPSWNKIKEIILSGSRQITTLPSIVHRDTHLSNWMSKDKELKLIDPRGTLQNKLTCYGDHLYDIGKLSYSVHGKYDWVIRDEYDFTRTAPGVFEYVFNPLAFDEKLEQFFADKLLDLGYNSYDVRFAEAAISISAAPVFYNSCEQQFILFLKGIETLMEIME